MSELPLITATPWKESSGTCDCCGRTSKTIWGDLSSEASTLAVYFVQWTLGAPEHTPNIDLVLGKWGDGAEAQERVLVSLLYRPAPSGGSFMVIDGEGRHSNRQAICGRGLGVCAAEGQRCSILDWLRWQALRCG